jgi:hypothetical protein
MIEFKVGSRFFSLFESTAETPNAVTTIWTQIERGQVMGWDLV